MNKTELIVRLAEEWQASKKQTGVMLEQFLNVISNTLKNGDDIKIIGFGSFKVSKVEAKIVTNPQNKQKIEVKSYKRVRFSPGANLKKAVNEDKAE